MRPKIITGICTVRDEIILLSGRDCEYLTIAETKKLIDRLIDALNSAIDYEFEVTE